MRTGRTRFIGYDSFVSNGYLPLFRGPLLRGELPHPHVARAFRGACVLGRLTPLEPLEQAGCIPCSRRLSVGSVGVTIATNYPHEAVKGLSILISCAGRRVEMSRSRAKDLNQPHQPAIGARHLRFH